MQRKVAVILAADVVGFSRLVAEDEEESLRRLMSYRQVFDEFVEQHGGRIFNTAGDAVLAEFKSSVESVRAAIDIQETLRTRNFAYPTSRQMLFRIGITVGDVVEREGDLLGDAVNVAARLQGLAVPGGIWISRSVHEQVSGKLSLSFRDLGAQSVKNIPTPIYVFAVMPDGAAEPMTVELHDIPAPAAPARKTGGISAVAVLVVAALAITAGAGWLLLRVAKTSLPQEPIAVEAPSTTAAEVAASSDDRFIPEHIPFIREDNRNDIKDGYVGARDYKAIALNRSGYGFVVAEFDLASARQKALASCQEATGDPCEIYAEGDRRVWPHPLPPMPPQPWLRDAPGAPEAFAADRVPFVRPADRALIESFPDRPLPRALSMNDDGYIGMSWGGAAREDPVRRSLEYCGDRSGRACQLIAVDGTFAVGLPRGFAITGLFRPQSDAALSPEQRTAISGVYAGSDWRAVAVGTSGIGVTVGRSSETEAVDAAMAECVRSTDACRVHAINDFRVDQGG